MNIENVLFLCTKNSARSQMAEGFLKHLAEDQFDVHSAGLQKDIVHPLAIKVMAEAGIDIKEQYSKDVQNILAK